VSVDEDKVPFLSRWSRRKLEAHADLPAQTELKADAAPAPTVAQPAPPPELPPLASLEGLKSEYKDFLHPQVDENLRRGALKKLFSDPHFNTMDMLDTYVDDYSIADPIPEAMLKRMIQSKTLALFDEDEKESAGKDADAGETPAGEPAHSALPDKQSQANSPAPAQDAPTSIPERFIPDGENTNN
jgi:hypothetical protein